MFCVNTTTTTKTKKTQKAHCSRVMFILPEWIRLRAWRPGKDCWRFLATSTYSSPNKMHALCCICFLIRNPRQEAAMLRVPYKHAWFLILSYKKAWFNLGGRTGITGAESGSTGKFLPTLQVKKERSQFQFQEPPIRAASGVSDAYRGTNPTGDPCGVPKFCNWMTKRFGLPVTT